MADRDVPHDIWRNIGSLASDEQDLALLEKAVNHEDKPTRYAAAFAASHNPLANHLRSIDTELNTLLHTERISWEYIDQLV